MFKKVYLLPIIAILTSFIMLACGSENTVNTETMEETTVYDSSIPYDDIISNVSYIEDGESYHMLDLYGTQSVDEATPVIIEIHGGGYIGGTKEGNANHSIFFARSGYVVVAPDYTKVQAANGGTFNAAIQDLFMVYNWVEENAEKYNFDLNNIFLSGDSAGGYYTLISDAIMHSETLQEFFGVTKPSFEFTAYVTTCPGTDIMALQDAYNSGAFVATSIGESQLFDTDLMSHMDLYSNVNPEVFKGVYLLTTPTDTTTGTEVLKFDKYLTDNNVEHTFKTYDGTENELKHVFNITNPDYVESIKANQDMVEYMDSLLK